MVSDYFKKLCHLTNRFSDIGKIRCNLIDMRKRGIITQEDYSEQEKKFAEEADEVYGIIKRCEEIDSRRVSSRISTWLVMGGTGLFFFFNIVSHIQKYGFKIFTGSNLFINILELLIFLWPIISITYLFFDIKNSIKVEDEIATLFYRYENKRDENK